MEVVSVKLFLDNFYSSHGLKPKDLAIDIRTLLFWLLPEITWLIMVWLKPTDCENSLIDFQCKLITTLIMVSIGKLGEFKDDKNLKTIEFCEVFIGKKFIDFLFRLALN
jgi:hypothetical protein